MNADAATQPTATPRRSWAAWLGALCVLALLLLVVFLPSLRDLVARSLREVWSMPPGSLALIVALKIGQALLSSLSWYNALTSAWPRSRLAYRFVVGVDQGQDVVNTVLPGRAGTWAMLGIVRGAIPGARTSTLLAAWGVHNLAFMLFAVAVSALAAAGGVSQAGGREGIGARVSGVVTDRPILTAAVAMLLVGAIAVIAVRSRARLAALRQHLAAGMAILRSPSRYALLLFLPALGSYVLRAVACVVLLDAYDIPVTIWTVALALGSNALAGAVRVTPGGLGTTQVADVVALSPYAAPEVITAFSLAELALTGLVSALVSAVALGSLIGWRGSRLLLRHVRRGELSAGLHAVGARQRRLRASVQARRRR